MANWPWPSGFTSWFHFIGVWLPKGGFCYDGRFLYPAPGRTEFKWNLLTTEANGSAIFEFGLIRAHGLLYARKVRERAFPIF